MKRSGCRCAIWAGGLSLLWAATASATNEHAHNTLGAVVQYDVLPALSLIVSPGLTFEDDEPLEVRASDARAQPTEP